MAYPFRVEFLRLFNKYRQMGYDTYTARYMAYRDLR